MKPITSINNTETILTSDINYKHLVVAVIKGNPTILCKGYFQDDSELSFFDLGDLFMKGNGYSYKGEDTIKNMVECAISQGEKVEVFLQKDWKKALQWLIDNA